MNIPRGRRSLRRVGALAGAFAIIVATAVAGAITSNPTPAAATPEQTRSLPVAQFMPTAGVPLTREILPFDLNGTRVVAIGGAFDQMRDVDGVIRTVKNFVLLNAETGAIYRPYSFDRTNSTDRPGYVRDIALCDGQLYIAGDFTKIDGVTGIRRIVRLLPNGNVDLAWKPNPAPPSRVQNIDCRGDRLIYGGDTQGAYAVSIAPGNPGNAITSWGVNGFVANSKKLVRNVYISPCDPNYVYIGGDHGYMGGVWRPGITKLSLATGAVDTRFNPALKEPDRTTVTGGEVGISISSDCKDRSILFGGAGKEVNSFRKLRMDDGAAMWLRTPKGSTTPAPAYKNLYGDSQVIVPIPEANEVLLGYHRDPYRNPIVTDDPARPAMCNNHAVFRLDDGEMLGGKSAPDSYTDCMLGWNPGYGNSISATADGNGGLHSGGWDPQTKTLWVGGAYRTENGQAQNGLSRYKYLEFDTEPEPTPTPTTTPTTEPTSPPPTSCITTPVAQANNG